MPRNTRLQDAIAERLGPVESIKGYLTIRYGSVAAWARRQGWYAEHVYMTLSGERPGEEVRTELARELGISREDVDAALESCTPHPA